MSRFTILTVILSGALYLARAGDVADPQAHYLADYQAGDYVKKLGIDVNGDGKTDFLFTYIEANPDPATRISDGQAGGSLSWDAYVANQSSNTFTRSVGVDWQENGDVTQGAGLDFDPSQMFVGNISEISRFGIVASAVKRSKSENSTIILAYTWEGDHFKRWKLAEYVAGEQNATFDKYLKDDKRTHVVLQQIKP